MIRNMKNRIAEWRIKRGLTQEELAEKIDRSVSMISRLENGTRSFDIDWLILLSKALECCPVDLLPKEWQRPGAVDLSLLVEAIEDAIDLVPIDKRSTIEFAHMIMTRYERRVEKQSTLISMNKATIN